MQEFDKKKEKKILLTWYKKDDKKKTETLLTNAKQTINQQLDDVKQMNQMVEYCKCATIRYKQLEELMNMEEIKREEDKRLVIIMEIEGLKLFKSRISLKKNRNMPRKKAQ